MSLEVAAPDGLGLSEEQAIHIQWNTLDEIITELMKAGFTPVDKPVYQLPVIHAHDYDTATSVKYSQWFCAFEAWQAYTTYHLHYSQAKRLEFTNEMKRLAATIKKNLRKEKPKPNEDAISDAVVTDPRYGELMRYEQQYKQYELMLEPQHEHIKGTLKLLSRHLAARQFEAELASGRGSRSYGSPG